MLVIALPHTDPLQSLWETQGVCFKRAYVKEMDLNLGLQVPSLAPECHRAGSHHTVYIKLCSVTQLCSIRYP